MVVFAPEQPECECLVITRTPCSRSKICWGVRVEMGVKLKLYRHVVDGQAKIDVLANRASRKLNEFSLDFP